MKEYFDRMCVPLAYREISLELVREPQAKVVKKYVEGMPLFLERGIGLLFWGEYGSGKTGAAALLLKRIAELGKTGLWVFASDIPKFVIEKTMFDPPQSFEERMLVVDLLVIDELILKSKRDAFSDTVVEMIFRRRLAERRATCITTNLSPKKLQEEYPAFANVLKESIFPVKFEGDFRSDKAKGIGEEFK